MKNFYLLAAIAGAIIPYLFFYGFIQNHGLDIPAFVQALFVNNPAGGFTADLLFTSCVFWIYMIHKNRESGAPAPYWFIILNLTIGLSCALPAYLYARERQTEK